MDVNSVQISGYVTDVAPDMITFSQVVGGKMKTEFWLFLQPKIRSGIPIFSPGDRILILDAMLYCKGTQWRLRVNNASQIVKIQREKTQEELYQGEEPAEQFI